MYRGTNKQMTSFLESMLKSQKVSLEKRSQNEIKSVYILHPARVVSSYAIIMYVCFSEYGKKKNLTCYKNLLGRDNINYRTPKDFFK